MECAFQSRREGLIPHHVKMFLQFCKQFGEMSAHLIGRIDAETSDSIRLTFGIYFLHTVVEEVCPYVVRIIFLFSQELEKHTFLARVGLGQQYINHLVAQ